MKNLETRVETVKKWQSFQDNDVAKRALSIAKLSPVPSWAEVALVPIDPATRHPPATHPPTRRKSCNKP